MPENENDLLGKEFLDSFKDTPITGADDIQIEENQNQNENENQLSAEDQAKQDAEKYPGKNADEIVQLKAQEKVDADKVAEAKLEEEKLSKMTPEEKEKYLEEKNKGTENNDDPNKNKDGIVKPFSEELLSHFDGKFKSVEEIKAALEKAPEKVEDFASEEVKNINDYVKAGGKLDTDYLAEISTDYDKITDGVEIAMRHLAATDPNFKNADDEELEYEVRKRYDMDNWSEDGEEVNDTRRVMEKKIQREVPQFREALKEKQNSIKFIKPVDPKIAEEAAKTKEAKVKEWQEKIVPEFAKNASKLLTQISDKETFEYPVDEKDLGEAVKVMNSMATDAKGFWDQFVDKDGKFDHKRVMQMILRDRSWDKATKLVREQGKAAGREEEIKKIKGIDFETARNKHSGQGVNQTMDQAIFESVKNHT